MTHLLSMCSKHGIKITPPGLHMLDSARIYSEIEQYEMILHRVIDQCMPLKNTRAACTLDVTHSLGQP